MTFIVAGKKAFFNKLNYVPLGFVPHNDLLKAAAEWKAKGRITGGTYAWVEDRHVMSAATAMDIPLLLDVAAACYVRLSDECLYEVRTLQQLVQRLGRIVDTGVR